MFLRKVRSFATNNFIKRLEIERFPTQLNVKHGVKPSSSAAFLSSTAAKPAQHAEHKRFRRFGAIVRQRPFIRYLVLGTLTAGTALYLWQLFVPDYRSEVDPRHYYSHWKIRLYTSLPWNTISRAAGVLSNIHVPVSMRESIYGTYVKMYDCKMDEALHEDLKAYPTFRAFFNRDLKENVRPISSSPLVSPADGTVLHFGKVTNGRIEYVKEHDYEIHEFLGPINTDTRVGYSLFQVVIYLAPGDYHAFHSPADWKALEKIHHPGFLLSVRPSYIDWIPKLFCMNERVVLSGHWKHGYFSMTAVAATNVGDIVINSESIKNRKVIETEQFNVVDHNYHFTPGVKVGEFRLGSTIVLIFEAPSNLQFCIKAGDTLRYGQSLVL
ncbi:phosphatidylserine decarboxylase domain-containing protein [Ditylenchus destructor]|uniref:phosphatidylserine decarboxylase n=1 Tax=Ditylenchus destructor TaxID=166010 RepID=A0AAD4NMJ0_9BILA|nr:phosphatidylserine decarboxylase domain-containing protein [Ditylenchus destructor]